MIELLQLIVLGVGPIATAAAAYGGVRAGQRALEHRVGRVERDVQRAHERIDRHLEEPSRANP